MAVRARTKLDAILDHARRSVPFYAALIPETKAMRGKDALNEVPVLDRSDLQRAGARLWSTHGDSSTWRVVRTSGTTGEPVSVLVDEDTRVAEAMVLAEHVDRCLANDAWRQRTLFHVTVHAGAGSSVMAAPSG